MIKITCNGSKWAGQPPDTIETLLEVLATEPLRPEFEDYGNFISHLDDPEHGYEDEAKREAAKGQVRFWGNFAHLSHSFNIDTDEPELIATLTKAIRDNQATAAYRGAKIARQKAKERQAAERQQREDDRKRRQIAELEARLATLKLERS